MANISQRIRRLEDAINAGACECAARFAPMAALEIVVVENDWTPERIRAADAEKSFTCPIHGQRLPPILHVSPTDMEL
jgi:hypothetical protein